MTTIAYRDGVLASDTMASCSGIADCEMVKIARNERGDLIGATGDAALNAAFLNWFTAGEKFTQPAEGTKEDESNGEAVVVRVSGEIEIYERGGMFKVKAPYYAVGSGKELALGAMAQGATAEQAVAAAIKHDVYSGGEIVALKHEVK